MNRDLLPRLVDPQDHASLQLHVGPGEGRAISEGTLVSPSGKTYPVVRGIPRFVSEENYASSFGYQWNKYARLQLDSENGTNFSRDRFREITEWGPEDLRGAWVLDGGCGAGRFAEIVLAMGARVVAVDLSSAVDACCQNLSQHQGLDVVQASLYQLPFREGVFDFVYSIGVIQHTPDPKAAVLALASRVKPGGRLGLWIYEKDWKAYLGTVGFKYFLRPWTRKMSRNDVELFSNRLEALCWPINRIARRCGFLGRIIMRMLPVASAYLQNVPLEDGDFREWVRLDTFDMYSPAHDHPQRFSVVASWLQGAGFVNIRRHPHGGISITAQRPR